MALRKVVVADENSQLTEAQVDEDRIVAFDGLLQRFGGVGALGTPNDVMSVLGRKPTARDATESVAFLVSQLAYTEQRLMTRFYEPPQGWEFVPISYEAGAWAEQIRYEIEDQVGNARWASSKATDTPTSDVGYAAKTFGVHHGKAGYQYTQQELRVTAFLRRPLPERRMVTTINAYRRFCSEVFLIGSTEKNLTGLYNNALVAHATAPSTHAWSGTATVAEVISDFGFGMYTAWTQSQQNVVPNRVIVPKLAYQWMSTTPINTTNGSNITVLNFLLQNNLCNQKRGTQLRIDPGYDNATIGASGAPRTVFYDDTDDTLVAHLPMPLQFLAPQFEDINVNVPGEFRVSGVEVKRPTGMYYMDGT